MKEVVLVIHIRHRNGDWKATYGHASITAVWQYTGYPEKRYHRRLTKAEQSSEARSVVVPEATAINKPCLFKEVLNTKFFFFTKSSNNTHLFG